MEQEHHSTIIFG